MAEIIERLRNRLSTPANQLEKEEECRAAAVLVPIFIRKGKIGVVFIKRPLSMRHHRGQFAFPGGSCDECDATLEETALREAKEEIGLDSHNVDIIGRLDDIRTGSRFIVTPIVGVFSHPYSYVLNPAEVDFVIEPLLSELKAVYGIYGVEYYYGKHLIWGATARILMQLLNTVY